MNRIGLIFLNVAVALYLFANGIFAITGKQGIFNTDSRGEFGAMINAIFQKGGDFPNALVVILGICAIAAGVFLLLALFRVDVPITDLILLIFICLWLVFILFVDIIDPIRGNTSLPFLKYLLQLAPHLMVLGALISSTRRFGSN